jgi:hypothetical protein
VYLGRSVRAKARKKQARVATGRLSKKEICDPALKQLWVPKQRAAAQLERLGLAYDANKCLSRDTPNNTESQLIQYYEQQVSNLQQVPRQPKHLSQSEKLYMSNIVKKYGTDFQRAFRDRKLNYLQWTVSLLFQPSCLYSYITWILRKHNSPRNMPNGFKKTTQRKR